MKILLYLWNKVFSVSSGKRKWYAVILWWELRRPLYNLIVGIGGIISLLIIFTADQLPPALTFEEAELEPLSFLIAGFLANIFYTSGWFCELIVRRILKEKAEYFGPVAFSMVIIFSLLVVSLPAVLNFGFWVVRFLKQ